MALGQTVQPLDRPQDQMAVGGVRDGLGLNGRVHRDPLQLALAHRLGLNRHFDRFREQHLQVARPNPLAPFCHRRPVERQAVLERLDQGDVRVLIATGQLIGEGFDRSDLSPLFLVTPIKFSGRVLQYLGRVLRPAPGKEKARVYDYVDVQVDVLKAMARARQKVYNPKFS